MIVLSSRYCSRLMSGVFPIGYFWFCHGKGMTDVHFFLIFSEIQSDRNMIYNRLSFIFWNCVMIKPSHLKISIHKHIFIRILRKLTQRLILTHQAFLSAILLPNHPRNFIFVHITTSGFLRSVKIHTTVHLTWPHYEFL